MRRSFRPFPLLAACAALAAAVPAAAQEKAADSAKARVALGAAFDSVAVVAGLARLPAPPEGAYPVFSAVFSPGGALLRVAPAMGTATPAAYAEPVVALLRASARALPPARDTVHLTLRAEGGAAPRLGLHEPVQVKPRVLDVEEFRRALSRVATEEAERERSREVARQRAGSTRSMPSAPPSTGPLPPIRLELRMRVEPDGTTTDHALTHRSASPAVNREVRRLAAEMLRFQPGTIDGRPVSVWVVLPVTLAFQ